MPSPPSPADDPLDRLSRAREELRSVADDEPDTGRIEIPSDAPPRAKVALGALAGLTPTGRLIAILAMLALVAYAIGKLGRFW